MCYDWVMVQVGLRELRQDASALVRKVEAGEVVEITVAGRLAARMVPAEPGRWRRWEEVADLFSDVTDPDWATDRDRIDQLAVNPWHRT